MPTIYHGTPLTPRAALQAVLPGRAACVSFYRPDDITAVEETAPFVMLDNGAFSFWKHARREGREFDETERDWHDAALAYPAAHPHTLAKG